MKTADFPTVAERSGGRRTLRRVGMAFMTACLIATGYVIANWEWPTGAASGRGLNGETSSRLDFPRRFRVATFNVHGGYGVDGRLDLARTASAMGSGIDFFGLNEVRGAAWENHGSQAEVLGRLLHMNWLFAPTEATWSGPHFGQGILSRLRVASWKRVPFSRVHGNGYRNYLECRLPLSGNRTGPHLTILVTHLDRKSDRQDQLRVLIARFLAVDSPAILMGDLNSKRTEPQLIQLANVAGVVDCFGRHVTGDLARRRIDWIFVRGLECHRANLEATDASDHPWGWAELELRPDAVPVAGDSGH